jgi:hypothetical protein
MANAIDEVCQPRWLRIPDTRRAEILDIGVASGILSAR